MANEQRLEHSRENGELIVINDTNKRLMRNNGEHYVDLVDVSISSSIVSDNSRCGNKDVIHPFLCGHDCIQDDNDNLRAGGCEYSSRNLTPTSFNLTDNLSTYSIIIASVYSSSQVTPVGLNPHSHNLIKIESFNCAQPGTTLPLTQINHLAN